MISKISKLQKHTKTLLKHVSTRVKKSDGANFSSVHDQQFLTESVDKERFGVSSVAQKNLDTVVEILNANEIDYFLVRGFTVNRYRIGISEVFRGKLVNAFTAIDFDKKYPKIYLSEIDETPAMSITETNKIKRSLEKGSIFRLWTNFSDDKGRLMWGSEQGCDIELWRDGNQISKNSTTDVKLAASNGIGDLKLLKNALIAPRNNAVSGWLPEKELKNAYTLINKKKYRTKRVFKKKLINDIDFPIDIVYTWVNSADQKWYKKYAKHSGKISKQNNNMSRYTSRDELKYSLRSIYMYAPFVRNIYIVTDQQAPEWLNIDFPNIKIVDHKDIFLDSSVLPVFNSHAIGSQLHHIEGLSEKYLYFNDDVFLGKPVSPNIFFSSNGLLKVSFSKAQFGLGKPEISEATPNASGKNVRRLLEKDFEYFITNKIKHVPQPQSKSIAWELESKYNKVFLKTAKQRFRGLEDIAFAGTLLQTYAYITSRATTSSYRSTTIDISQKSANKELDELLQNKSSSVFCLNESNTADNDREIVTRRLINFLEAYFPLPAPWEVENQNRKNDFTR